MKRVQAPAGQGRRHTVCRSDVGFFKYASTPRGKIAGRHRRSVGIEKHAAGPVRTERLYGSAQTISEYFWRPRCLDRCNCKRIAGETGIVPPGASAGADTQPCPSSRVQVYEQRRRPGALCYDYSFAGTQSLDKLVWILASGMTRCRRAQDMPIGVNHIQIVLI